MVSQITNKNKGEIMLKERFRTTMLYCTVVKNCEICEVQYVTNHTNQIYFGRAEL